jgi:ubiquinone/menaquinone biosynthesis C-methylase UbiE
VRALPFDPTFNACRADRLFQVLPASVDPEVMLAEIARVTKISGWIVAADAVGLRLGG